MPGDQIGHVFGQELISRFVALTDAFADARHNAGAEREGGVIGERSKNEAGSQRAIGQRQRI